MNFKITKLFLAGSILIAAGVANAADPIGYYSGFSVGQSRIDPNTSTIDGNLSSAASLTSLGSTIDRNDTGYKIRLGYNYGNGLAVEAGYIDFGKANYNGSFTGGSAAGSIKANGINIDALVKLPVMQNVELFGKAGVLASSLKTEAIANGISIGDSTHRLVPGLGFGVDYTLSRNVALRAEWERYFRLGTDNSGRSEADLASVGVDFRF